MWPQDFQITAPNPFSKLIPTFWGIPGLTALIYVIIVRWSWVKLFAEVRCTWSFTKPQWEKSKQAKSGDPAGQKIEPYLLIHEFKNNTLERLWTANEMRGRAQYSCKQHYWGIFELLNGRKCPSSDNNRHLSLFHNQSYMYLPRHWRGQHIRVRF